MSTVATKLPAEIKKLSDLDAIFVDLRVSSMDEAILAVLEGKKLDSDGFGQAVKDAHCELFKVIHSQWGHFTDLAEALGNFMALMEPWVNKVLECVNTPQKRLNKNDWEVFKHDVVKPHVEYSSLVMKLKRLVLVFALDRIRVQVGFDTLLQLSYSGSCSPV